MLANRFRRSAKNISLLVVTASLIMIGCVTDSDSTGSPNLIANIQIAPDSLSIPVGETGEFTAFALDESGDTLRDESIKFNWWSTDKEVFTVEGNGTATGQEAGTAFCVIEIATRNRAFTGRDSAFVRIF